jgi:hypothetical protein
MDLLRQRSASSSGLPDSHWNRWRHRFPLAGVFLLALLAYSNSFTGTFVFDDVQHVRDNLRIRDLGALVSWEGYLALRHRFVGYLTFALNYRLGELSAFDYHLVNFCIHAITAALVYALVLLASRTPRLRSSTPEGSSQAVAFFAAALFATHPIQTQAVTYIVQRFTSLAALFYVLTVVLYLRWRLNREAGEGSRTTRAVLYAGVLLSAVLGMKTKETAFTVPLAVILCELSFFDLPAWRRRFFLLPIAATMLVIPLSYLGSVAMSAPAVAQATRVQTTVSRLDYLLTQAPVVVTYLRLLAWPAGQNLDHDFPLAHGFLEPRVLAAGLALVVLMIVALLLYRCSGPGRTRGAWNPGARVVAFGIAWFFLSLAVESSVVPIADVINEHRVYLPSVGIFVGAAGLAGLLARRVHPRGAARAVVVAAMVLSAVLGVATFRRNRAWASEISIWSDAAQKSPGKSRPHANLGTALCVAGRLDEGARELRRAVEIDPGSSYARAQLGASLVTLGRLGEAEPELREVVRTRPNDPEVLFNLGIVLLRTGRVEEAKPVLKRFLDVAPATHAAARRIAERALR